MERFFGIAQDVSGNAIPSCTVTVTLAGTGTSATLFSDNAYTPLANPFTSETDGAYQFYAGDGRYDIVLAKTGVVFDDDDTANVILSDRSSVISPAQITAAQNDYSPTNGLHATTWRINSDATRSITGIAAGKSQQQITLVNTGSFNINLAHSNAGSVAANRFSCPNSRGYALFPGESVQIYYDTTSTVWRVVPFQGVRVIDAVGLGTIISNSSAETTIYTKTIAGGLLGTNSKVRLSLTGKYTNTVGADNTILRVKYGGTTLATTTNLGIAVNTDDYVFIQVLLSADSATSSQLAMVNGITGNAAGSSHNETGARGLSNIDSTVDQTFVLTWDFATASGGITFTREFASLEWLP